MTTAELLKNLAGEFKYRRLVSAHVGRPAARKGDGPATERRAWKRLSPRLRAVASSEVKMAEMSAPSWERKPPVTLRWMTEGRRSCSEALLVGGTSGRSKKTKRRARCSR